MKNDKPNIIFLLMDSARQDHMSFTGYKRKTTPYIDDFIKESTVFMNAYSQASWTLPSHTSFFTGLYPTEHGLTRGNLNAKIYLNKKIKTITQILKSNGYITGGFSNNPWISEISGLEKGFDFFLSPTLKYRSDDILRGIPYTIRLYNRLYPNSHQFSKLLPYFFPRYKMTKYTFQILKKWLVKVKLQNNPFYAFINVMDPHPPYSLKKEYFKKIGTKSFSVKKFNLELRKIAKGKKLNKKEKEIFISRYNDCYDASLNHLDEYIGDFINFLKNENIYNNSLLIITSDHGKNLGEYEYTNDLKNLMDVNLKVPLILFHPYFFKKGKKIFTSIELIDLFFTITEILDIGEDELNSEKRKSLFDIIDGKQHEYIYSEYDMKATKGEIDKDENIRIYSIIKDNKKYLRSTKFGAKVYLKDENNIEYEISNQHIIDQYGTLLDKKLKKFKKREDAEGITVSSLDKSLQNRLKSLGYLD